MQNEESQQIIRRMFVALDTLKETKVIRGRQTFANRYGINRRNFSTLEKEPWRDMFELSWLAFLVRDYGVSARWLMTWEGSVMENDAETQL